MADNFAKRLEEARKLSEARGGFSRRQEDRDQIRTERTQKEEAADWGQVADLVSRGLTQWGAGKAGVSIGSGTGFNWDAMRKRAEDRYSTELGDIQKTEKEEGGVFDEAMKKPKDELSYEDKLKLKKKYEPEVKKRAYQQTKYLTKDGDPVGFDPATNKMISMIDGKPITDPKNLAGNYIKLVKNPETGNLEPFDSRIGKYVEDIAHGEEGEEPSLNPFQRGEMLKLQKEFKSNNQGLLKGRRAIKSVRELINLNNPISRNAVKTQMPRLMGEVGNLNQTEQEAFGGSAAITDRLEQIFETWTTGKLSSSNQGYLTEIVDAMEKANTRNYIEDANNTASKKSKLLKMKATEIKDLLLPDSVKKQAEQDSSVGPTLDPQFGDSGKSPKTGRKVVSFEDM